MAYKAYIVANKKQELDVLNNFEQNNFLWDEGEKPTEWVPSETAFVLYSLDFPYVLASGDDEKIIWFMVDEITDEEVVYDGRKEDKMYKVTQEFMKELIKWRDNQRLGMNTELISSFLDVFHIKNFPDVVDIWWTDSDNTIENNNRLIAIIKWLNGENVFEVEEPHKFVVRSDKTDCDGDYLYVEFVDGIIANYHYILIDATKFDTREEAKEWANSHQVVVEIDAEGNEVG